MQKKSEKIIFTLYLLGFLALALTLALLQPLANTPPLYGNPPDEHARYLIPQFICKYGKIPTGWEEEVRIPAYGFSYALYNVIGSGTALYRKTGERNLWPADGSSGIFDWKKSVPG